MKKNPNTDPFYKSWTLFLLFQNHAYVVLQFCPSFKFYFPLFQTHYRTLQYPKTKENKIWTKDKIKPQHKLAFLVSTTCPKTIQFSFKEMPSLWKGSTRYAFATFLKYQSQLSKAYIASKNLTNLSILLVLRLFVTSKTSIHISMANISSISWWILFNTS